MSINLVTPERPGTSTVPVKRKGHHNGSTQRDHVGRGKCAWVRDEHPAGLAGARLEPRRTCLFPRDLFECYHCSDLSFRRGWLMYLTAQVVTTPERSTRLLACLLRLPCRFDPLQVLGFDGLVPVCTPLALLLGACHMPMLHGVLLPVCGGDHMTLCPVLRSLPREVLALFTLAISAVLVVVSCP